MSLSPPCAPPALAVWVAPLDAPAALPEAVPDAAEPLPLLLLPPAAPDDVPPVFAGVVPVFAGVLPVRVGVLPDAPVAGRFGRAGGESTAAVDSVSMSVTALPAVAAAGGVAVGDDGDGVPVVPVAAGADGAVEGVADCVDAGVAVFRTAGGGVTAPVGAVSRVVAPERATARVASSSRRASDAEVADRGSTFSSPRLVTGLGVVLSARDAESELAAIAALSAAGVADAGLADAAAALSVVAAVSRDSPPLHAVTNASVSAHAAARPGVIIVGFVIGKCASSRCVGAA